jgi:hypothetical protein
METKKMSLRHRRSGDGDTKGRFWGLCGVPPQRWLWLVEQRRKKHTKIQVGDGKKKKP